MTNSKKQKKEYSNSCRDCDKYGTWDCPEVNKQSINTCTKIWDK